VSRALPEFEERGGGGFRSWLIRIAHNESINALRHRVRRPAEVYPDQDSIADPDAGAEATTEAIALNDWLAKLCDQLPDGQRDVIRLRFAGLTTGEIAIVLGKTESAVRKATERATERLVELGKRDVGHWHD
jgi:RNA polymerase sigma-70 factor (ECF subfamily)